MVRRGLLGGLGWGFWFFLFSRSLRSFGCFCFFHFPFARGSGDCHMLFFFCSSESQCLDFRGSGIMSGNEFFKDGAVGF